MKLTYAAQLSGIYGKSPPNHTLSPAEALDSDRKSFLDQASLAMIEAGGKNSFASGNPVAKSVTERTVLLPIHRDEIPLEHAQALLSAEQIRVFLFLPDAMFSLSLNGQAEIRLDLALRQPFAISSDTEDDPPDLPIAVIRLSVQHTAFHPLKAWKRARIWSNPLK